MPTSTQSSQTQGCGGQSRALGPRPGGRAPPLLREAEKDPVFLVWETPQRSAPDLKVALPTLARGAQPGYSPVPEGGEGLEGT